MAIAATLLALLGCWLLTGHDPLGLFTQSEVTPTSQAAPSAEVAPPTAPPTGSATGKTSNWWQVYFTDPNRINDPSNLDGSIAEELIERIDNAQSTIHIAAFEFDLAPVAEALIAAEERGVEVEWFTDDEYGIEADEDEGYEFFPMMEDAGVEVRDDDRSALMHNKFWIFDAQTVWTGSTNITKNGIFRNNNNVIVIDSPEVAEIYEREFAELWAGQYGPTSPSTVDEQSVRVKRTPVQVLFAAEDEVVSRLITLVESAEESVRFMVFSFTHDRLGSSMLERAQAGVDVQGIFETRGSETEYSELTNLHCAGVPVRQDGNPGTFHHKVIVIDDEIVITGSLNFSENADNSNDENVLILTSRTIASEYLREFKRRWAEASEPDPQDIKCD